MSNLGFVNIQAWVPDQVANWLRGLDDLLLPYVHFFLNAEVTGRQLLCLTHHDLDKLNMTKFGHQELILEATDMLRTLYYELESINVQSLALRVGCKARCLHNEIKAYLMTSGTQAVNGNSADGPKKIPIAFLTTVSDVVNATKDIVSWLDRPPFDSSDEYNKKRSQLIRHGLDLIVSTQGDKTLNCEERIMQTCLSLSDMCEGIIQESKDPLVIQPASLEIATIRKKPEEDLGMHIQSSYNGTHIIGGIKDQSPADLCNKIEEGDQVIQVNYQTVVGWHLKKLVAALRANKKEVTLTLKKRPHHANIFGPHGNRRKVPKNVKQSTFPKAFRRKSQEKKGSRAPLTDFLSTIPPASQPFSESAREHESDNDNDNDNDVFQNTSTSSALLPLPLETHKQRRATVSGGSPPAGKRNSIEIGELASSGRPKSYTISSPSSESSHLDFSSPSSDLLSPHAQDDGPSGEMGKAGLIGAKGFPGAVGVTSPVSVSITTPNYTPTTPAIFLPTITHSPAKPSELGPLTKTYAPGRQGGSPPGSGRGEAAGVGSILSPASGASNSGGVTPTPGSSTLTPTSTATPSLTPTTSPTLTPSPTSGAAGAGGSAGVSPLSSSPPQGQDPTALTPGQGPPKAVIQPKAQTPSKGQSPPGAQTPPKGQSSPGGQTPPKAQPPLGAHTPPGAQPTFTKSVTPPGVTNQSPAVGEGGGGHPQAETPTAGGQARLPAGGSSLQIVSSEDGGANRKRKGSEAAVMEVAGGEHGSPTLLRVTRINSQRRGEMADQERLERERLKGSSGLKTSVDLLRQEVKANETRPDSSNQSYTVNIVGGVPQKVANTREPKESPTQSPSSLLRKKHAMRRLGAARRVSCKDLGGGDCQGWLYKKREGGGLIHKHWAKRWFVLKEKNLYYFKDPEEMKAQGVLHLPAFKISPAPEIKTKKFAFKAYHSGFTFYFASERQDDMSKWMNKMGIAAIFYDTSSLATTSGFTKPDKDASPKPDVHVHAYYDESDEESDTTSMVSGFSTPNSPPTPRASPSPSSSREDLSQSTDELVAEFQNLRRADLDFDGVNVKQQRKSTLTKTEKLKIRNSKEVSFQRKLQGLQRTLREKERELAVIDGFLSAGDLTVGSVTDFRRNHPDIIEMLYEEEIEGSSDTPSESEDVV